jgi:hypothetical protein
MSFSFPVAFFSKLNVILYPRPTGYTTPIITNTTFTNPSNAYDTTTSGPDTSTYADQITSAVSTAIGTIVYTGIGTVNGTLNVNLSTITEDNISSNELNEAFSYVNLLWSKDGGSTWSSTGWSLGNSFGFTNDLTQQTNSVTISGATGDVQVKVETQSERVGSGLGLATATSEAKIYDIWMT